MVCDFFYHLLRHSSCPCGFLKRGFGAVALLAQDLDHLAVMRGDIELSQCVLAASQVGGQPPVDGSSMKRTDCSNQCYRVTERHRVDVRDGIAIDHVPRRRQCLPNRTAHSVVLDHADQYGSSFQAISYILPTKEVQIRQRGLRPWAFPSQHFETNLSQDACAVVDRCRPVKLWT